MRDILNEMEVRDGSIIGSAIISWDAFPVVSALEKSIDENSVASISATLISIGQIAVDSMGAGELEEVWIMSKNGSVLVSKINSELLLSAFVSPKAKLGIIFSLIKQAVESVKKLTRMGGSRQEPK